MIMQVGTWDTDKLGEALVQELFSAIGQSCGSLQGYGEATNPPPVSPWVGTTAEWFLAIAFLGE